MRSIRPTLRAVLKFPPRPCTQNSFWTARLLTRASLLWIASKCRLASAFGMGSTKRSTPLQSDHLPLFAEFSGATLDCPMAAGTTAAATIKWNSLGFVAFAFDPFWLDDVS